MKKRPEEVKLSQEDGEALIEWIKADTLTGDDQRLLVKLIELYFWLTWTLRETKISLKRLKTALFGEGGKPRKPRNSKGGEGVSNGGDGGRDDGGVIGEVGRSGQRRERPG